jgi:2,4-dienoyl-CoA reductase-like NADH-dependent reductase (Old Yellow Enzyme family)
MSIVSDTVDSALKPLFAPGAIGSMQVRNRIVMAPMTRAFCPGGVPGPDVVEYYRKRAEGGVGLIVTEGTWVGHEAASNDPNVPRFHGDDALAGWSAVCQAVQAAGARIVPQLWHVGNAAKSDVAELFADRVSDEPVGMGPSGLLKSGVSTGRAMTETDIASTLEAFAAAACDAHRLGFDGVELHGAHGYLIDQFFWHETNLRTDRYGGGIAERARFAADLVREIKRRTAPDFPVILRFSQWKMQDYAARIWSTPGDLAAFLEVMVEAGVDAFHCSQRRFWLPEFASSDLNLAGWTRKLSGKPTITVGSVSLDNEMISTILEGGAAGSSDLAELVRRLADEEFDFVAVGRALINNPTWPQMIAEGRLAELQAFSAADLTRLV